MADVPHDLEVVADEEVAHAEVALQVHEQVEDLALHGQVERGDGLVADDELGLQRQGPGDADALELAARERGRPSIPEAGVDAHAGQQVIRPASPLAAVVAAVDDPGLGHEVAGKEARVQGRARVLVDELDVLAHLAQGLAPQRQQVDAAEQCAAGVRLHEAQQDACRRGLARAGAAHEAVRLAGLDGQVDILDGRDDTPLAASPGGERLAQTTRVKEEADHRAPA